MFYTHKLYGQDQAVSFLRNAFTKGQVAHAYLYSGKRGLGKKLLACKFAQSLNCGRDSLFTDCTCDTCRRIVNNTYPDVQWIGLEDDVRSIKINDIRALQSTVMLRPLEGKHKVFIFNKAERLTEEAANAFLKTLEEPPPDTYFILLVEHGYTLPATIMSRVVEVRLQPLPFEELAHILTTDFTIGTGAHYLAYQAQGSVGLALQYHAENFFGLKNAVIDAFLAEDTTEYFLGLLRISSRELDTLLHVLSSFMHDVLLMQHKVDSVLLIHQDRTADILAVSERLTATQIMQLSTVFEEAREALSRNVNRKLLLTDTAAHTSVIMQQTLVKGS